MLGKARHGSAWNLKSTRPNSGYQMKHYTDLAVAVAFLVPLQQSHRNKSKCRYAGHQRYGAHVGGAGGNAVPQVVRRSAPHALLCSALICRFNAFQEQKVPGNWGKAPTGLRTDHWLPGVWVHFAPAQVAYPCLKPLNSWVLRQVRLVACGCCHEVLQS